MNHIYFLHAGDFVPRYVGLTTKGLEPRLSQHKKDRRHNQHKINWVNKHSENLDIFELETGNWTAEEMKAKEVYWIARLKALGHNLLNATEGGDYSPNKGKVAHNKGQYKYDDALIDQIASEYIPGKVGYYRLSKKYGLPQSTVERYVRERTNWGGSAGINWAISKLKQIDKKK